MTLVADKNGVVSGAFTIPPKVKAGTKRVTFAGSGGSHGEANFTGQGTLSISTARTVTTVSQDLYDPLAQTFTLSAARQLSGVELFFTAVGTSPVIVQVRNVQTGFPGQEILAEARLNPADIKANDWNRFVFDTAYNAQANVQLALVVLCNDAVSACAIAELGKWDTVSKSWVTAQTYQVGVLLSSSNASTWTAHQDKDLTFRLLARRYTETTRTIELGKVTVAGATDLLISAMTDNPVTGADSSLQLSLPDGSYLNTGDGQIIQLSTPVTGDITVRANLRATGTASALVGPGSQVIAGNMANTAEYISRAIIAKASGCKVRILYDGKLPSGSTVAAFICGTDQGDTWVQVPVTSSPRALGDGIYEYQHYITDVKEANVRVKLVLSGSPAARPYVFNLRVSIT